MAKHVFPVSFESFVKFVDKAAVGTWAKLLQVDEEDAIRFMYNCASHGWRSKQYHKEYQDRTGSELQEIRKAMAKDPSLKQRILGHDKQ